MRPTPGTILAAVACIAVAALTGCADPYAVTDLGPAPQLTESSSDSSSTGRTSGQSGDKVHRYSRKDLVSAVLTGPSATGGQDVLGVRQALQACPACLHRGKPFTVAGLVFASASVVWDPARATAGATNGTADSAGKAGDPRPFAQLLFTTDERTPDIALVTTGRNITLTPGGDRTVVAEERSGAAWAVRVYRYVGGRFEGGQRIEHIPSPTPTP
ncbi:hypothetical protein NQ036_09890 [Brevibacterium sp. 91QC2O2]|uniref:hypothetical protein n=1 Tax=Brevibacterium sp. 91QC2O2 TaxID=2968458 RepID=UPI00211D07C4|nr:hypothetical protein [Brevibacterium sp. 91QC2O2]MCQ9368545.1 hypothetical protein [Brevibacterium sp. 91QC2O2]